MGKIIKYKFFSSEDGVSGVLLDKEVRCPDSVLEINEEIAKREAYNGEYTIEDDGVSPYPLATYNIMKDQYVTISGTLYKATENIPHGEPVIVGQNAIETTVEEQLNELMKGE